MSPEELLDRKELEYVAPKLVGGTVGKIVQDRHNTKLMLKKSGRGQKDAKDLSEEEIEIERSQDITIEKRKAGIAESFNEKCAAELFQVIKQVPGYLPKFKLVYSTFSPDKEYNKYKKGALKVYVASEIIGDHNKINDEVEDAKHSHLVNRSMPSHPEILEDLIDDVCENAVIMFLLSNYDVKVDNFVHPSPDDRLTAEENAKRQKWMIPIDFGQARYSEKSEVDVCTGFDLIRRSRAGTTKVLSAAYANEQMRQDMVKGVSNIGTQTFYYKNLKPRHFLKVIENLKSDPEIEQKLRKIAYDYTFGTPEEKLEYANVIAARVRNFKNLESIFANVSEASFPERNLRDILANSEEFEGYLRSEDDLLLEYYSESEDFLKAGNSSKGRNFYALISKTFNEVKQRGNDIAGMLENYGSQEDTEAKEEIGRQINVMVNDFNQYAKTRIMFFKETIEDLEREYADCEYLKDKSERKGGWPFYKQEILSRLTDSFIMLQMPLLDEDELSEEESVYDPDRVIEFGDNSDSEEGDKVTTRRGLYDDSSSDDESEKSQEIEADLEEDSWRDEFLSQGATNFDIGYELMRKKSAMDESEEESSSDSQEIESSEEDEQIGVHQLKIAISDDSPVWNLEKWGEYKEKLESLIADDVENWQKLTEKSTKYLMTHLSAYDEMAQVKRTCEDIDLDDKREAYAKFIEREKLRDQQRLKEKSGKKTAEKRVSSKKASVRDEEGYRPPSPEISGSKEGRKVSTSSKKLTGHSRGGGSTDES